MYDACASAIRSRIDCLDVPTRAIFSLPAVFKREALSAPTEAEQESNFLGNRVDLGSGRGYLGSFRVF